MGALSKDRRLDHELDVHSGAAAICLEQLGAGRGGSTEGNRTLPEQKPEVKFIKTPACTELFLRTTGSTFEDAL
ncbi:unnamed protein product [Rangifer tarandus platyrhynchus]|uniref:Uncharacterized protein n=1 Tax=Rangifer tarandus platyrhynchus TaxID=3082113 RepID=A0AC59YV70_RANTA